MQAIESATKRFFFVYKWVLVTGCDGDPLEERQMEIVAVIGGMVVSGMSEKPAMMAMGSTDRSTNTQVHHQITIMAGNISGSL